VDARTTGFGVPALQVDPVRAERRAWSCSMTIRPMLAQRSPSVGQHAAGCRTGRFNQCATAHRQRRGACLRCTGLDKHTASRVKESTMPIRASLIPGHRTAALKSAAFTRWASASHVRPSPDEPLPRLQVRLRAISLRGRRRRRRGATLQVHAARSGVDSIRHAAVRIADVVAVALVNVSAARRRPGRPPAAGPSRGPTRAVALGCGLTYGDHHNPPIAADPAGDHLAGACLASHAYLETES